ncbi:MAG: FAD-binding oxidoreductase, partial [Bdellovibrionales bacterium]|nr:FAD-binding oxidoreductase [Bdellovibrionales bacterium]
NTQIVSIIKICNEFKISFYAVSSGKNWGYGGASPVENDVLILDLSKMKKILEFNKDLHYVTVQPGVTQQDLYEYMKINEYKFMVPTTGAGPDVSLLGNAVERGYGITPHEDHFGSLFSLKAILPNGQVYSSSLSELGGYSVDSIFKWNIGPYLDGIFTQSNLGIVVEVTIALVPAPKNVTQFVVFLNEEDFEGGVIAVKNIKTKLSGIVGGVNLMNKRRLLAMIEADWSKDKALEEIHVIEFAKKRDLPDWAMVGAIYGESEIVGAAKRIMKKECKEISKKVVFLSKRKYKFARSVLKFLPLKNLKQMLDNAGRALEVLEGTPSKVALPLAYLKNKKGIPYNQIYNPDKDNCGLIWFAPLMPLDPAIVRDFVQELSRICLLYDIEPLITLTSFSSRCIDSTIPILFSKENPLDIINAKACYEELLASCKVMGLVPYRLDIDHMSLLHDEKVVSFKLASEIKKIVDPNKLFAPGRYIK